MNIAFCADTVTMARELDPFRIPRAGLETIPLAGLATLPLLGGQANLGPRQLISEATLAGVLVYAAYQTLLSGLRTEAMVRRGELGRAGQVALIGRSVWASMKEGTAPYRRLRGRRQLESAGLPGSRPPARILRLTPALDLGRCSSPLKKGWEQAGAGQ